MFTRRAAISAVAGLPLPNPAPAWQESSPTIALDIVEAALQAAYAEGRWHGFNHVEVNEVLWSRRLRSFLLPLSVAGTAASPPVPCEAPTAAAAGIWLGGRSFGSAWRGAYSLRPSLQQDAYLLHSPLPTGVLRQYQAVAVLAWD